MSVVPTAPTHLNIAVVRGTLSRAPEARDLPSGDRVGAFEVTVRREGEPTDTIPVAWPGVPDRALELTAGTEVVAVGRIRRRFFRTPAGTASRTELVASSIVRAGQRARVARLVEGAVAAIAAPAPPPG